MSQSALPLGQAMLLRLRPPDSLRVTTGRGIVYASQLHLYKVCCSSCHVIPYEVGLYAWAGGTCTRVRDEEDKDRR